MYLLIGILFVIAGMIMLVSPKTIFQIVEGWKGTDDKEPSTLYKINLRVGGVVFLILGIASSIASLIHLI